MKELRIMKYIKDHEDWEESLGQAPYNLVIAKDEDYPELRLFKYNQIESDMRNPLVKECRGIVIDVETFEVVAYPFDKFFNFNDERADEIDWNSAVIQEKVDGSIMKLYYYKDKWMVGTNGTIDAFKTPVGAWDDLTFGKLFMQAAEAAELIFDDLDKRNTYIFELVSPYNRVVVPYREIDLYHIGTRNIDTYEELSVDIDIQKPKVYKFQTFDEMVEVAQALPFDEEGYVVVDKYYNRVKVKSMAYLQVHHLHNNGRVDPKRVLNLIASGEDKEFLNYYPEYNEIFEELREEYALHVQAIERIKKLTVLYKAAAETKKDFAMMVLKHEKIAQPYFFSAYNGEEALEAFLEKREGKLIPENLIKEI
jgi:hypothetical protein